MIPDIYELVYCPPVERQDHYCITTPFIRACVSLSHILVCLKSSVNWIIYLLAGKKFRRVWCETYLPTRFQPKLLQRQGARYTKHGNQVKRGRNVILEGNIEHQM